MKPISTDSVLKTVKEYFLMAFGMMLYSFGWIGCILPVRGTGGGAAGLSLVVCNALVGTAGTGTGAAQKAKSSVGRNHLWCDAGRAVRRNPPHRFL